VTTASRMPSYRAVPFVVLLFFAFGLPTGQAQQQADPAAQGATRASQLPDFTDLVRKQGPAVVNIITMRQREARAGFPPQLQEDPFFDFFRRFIPDLPERMPAPPRQAQGIGSGFIISEDGYILTNAHVVAEAAEVTVRMADAKREFTAKVVGADERTDIALLKVDGNGLPVVTLGKAANLEPGQWVAAIGSPFGFANTITAGIVSATDRALPADTYVPFIQTDVAVNPGNSGGPLLNLAGEVVGINSMIYSRTGGFMGVSFAIPIEAALDVAQQLRETGKVTRGRLGIGIQPLTKELAASFGLDTTSGVVIVNVESGAPAEKAGLQIGDVILEYNGQPIEQPNDLPRLVARTKPGEQAKMVVWRQGERQTLAATVGEMPASAAVGATKPGAPDLQPGGLGLSVRELSPEERKQLGVDYGLRVIEVSEKAAGRTTLQPGDVIVGVARERFDSLEAFNKLMEGRRTGERVPLLVRRGEATLYIPMEVG
jgi:serine protease Do